MARVWWSEGTLPRSQRMNAITGPRSRCPSRYRKSDTISPSVSRYQSRAWRNRVVPSATWPSRWISAGRRAGRWVALARAGPGPRAAAHHQARGGCPPAAQQQGLRGPVGHGEAEVGVEPLGAVQVRLLELQPGQPGRLDQGMARPAGVLPGPRACLAVQGTMRIPGGSRASLDLYLRVLFHHDRLLHA